MPRPPGDLPADLMRSGFSRSDARLAGVGDGGLSRRRASGKVRRLGPSLWVPAGLPVEMGILTGIQRLIPAAAISHTSAARLWAADAGCRRAHVTIPLGPNLRTTATYVVHRDHLREAEVVVHRGLRVTEPYRTAMDVARTESSEAAVVILDALLWAELIEYEELRDRLARVRGRRGVRAARSAVELARYGAASPAETRLRLALVQRGVPEPRLQHPVETPGGPLAAVLAWPDRRLVIEYDGFDPHSTLIPFQRDRRRWGWFRDAGWEVRVYTAESLRRRDEIAAEVLRLLA